MEAQELSCIRQCVMKIHIFEALNLVILTYVG